jgi:Ca-activated chloride channel family protein
MTPRTTNVSVPPPIGAASDLPLEGVTAEGRLEGLLFELEVEQRYRNTGERPLEAVFSFPVPVRAVLLGLELELGERTLKAVAVKRCTASETYERAIDAGDAAALLESAGNGLYTVSVGNLLPGECAVIRYRHAELLAANRGGLRLLLPTVIAPRYGDPAEAGLEGPAIPLADLLVEYPFDLRLELVGVATQADLRSPTHPIRIERTETGVRVALAKPATLDRDFVLEVPKAVLPRAALLARDGEEWVVVANAVLEDLPAETRPLALTLLLDCSGSMQGDSIDAARRAVGRILDNLTEADRIAMLRFGSATDWLTRGFETASRARIDALRATARNIQADLGGTEMGMALSEALRPPLAIGEIGDLLLVTDGQVQELERLITLIAPSGRRLFVVAVGAAPNEGLARRLAAETGGGCEFVAAGELAEEAIVRMFRRLRAEPRVVRGIEWPQSPRWALPAPKAVFPEETIHLIAGFAARPSGCVRVRVQTTAGAERIVELPVSAVESTSTTVTRVAAARRLSVLDEAAATALAERHQIASAFTSFVVVAERGEAEKARSLPATRAVPQMLAAGWGGAGRVDLYLNHAPTPPMPLMRSPARPMIVEDASADFLASPPSPASAAPPGTEAPRTSSPLGPDRAREILSALSIQSSAPDFRALEEAGVPAAIIASLRRSTVTGPDFSERRLVDALIEALIRLAGEGSVEAKALRAVWKAPWSLFRRNSRRLRQYARELLENGGDL